VAVGLSKARSARSVFSPLGPMTVEFGRGDFHAYYGKNYPFAGCISLILGPCSAKKFGVAATKARRTSNAAYAKGSGKLLIRKP
jgi:hypothetical protein